MDRSSLRSSPAGEEVWGNNGKDAREGWHGKGDFSRACVKVATAQEATDISKASDRQLEGHCHWESRNGLKMRENIRVLI